MANYRNLHAALRAEVVADLKKIIDINGEIIFHDLETGNVFIDIAVGGRDGNGCYPDVVKIYKDVTGNYYVLCVDSEGEELEYKIDVSPDLSLGDLCGIYDEAVNFLAGDRKPRYSMS